VTAIVVLLAAPGPVPRAVADILTGRVAPSGKLPFALPADAASVETQKEDAPSDFARVLFPMGFGLSSPSTDK
jgi:beta-glucosidase